MSCVAGVMGTVILGAVAAGCRGGEPTPPPGLNEAQFAGWQVYVDLECATCHGEYREGRRSGPELNGLARNWTADKLVTYLEDPDAMIKTDPQLAYRAEKYAIGMPSVSGKTPGYVDIADAETLQAVAEYLLVDIEQPGE